LFDAAPVAVGDVYELGADHRLTVDVAAPAGPPAFDDTKWSDPVGPFKAVGPGETVTEQASFSVGYLPTSYGEVSVTGPDARWVISDWTEIGHWGRGTVTVADGGNVRVINGLEIGSANGYGRVAVRGAGSVWASRNWVTVGSDGGRGILTIEDGASVGSTNWLSVADSSNARSPLAEGRVVLTGAGSRLAVQEWMQLGTSTGGTGVLYVGNGTTVSTHSINAWDGSRVQGGGKINADVHTSGLTVGQDELLAINGLLNLGGTARFDIGGTERGTSYGTVVVGGAVNASLQRTVLNFVNDFAPRAGDRFTLITGAGGVSAALGEVEVRGLAPGFQYSIAKGPNSIVLTALNDSVAAPAPAGRGVLANDLDDDRDDLAAVLVRRPAHGTLSLNRDGSFSYVPGPTFTGTDSFEYAADDGVFTSAPAVVTIRNLAPVAKPDAYAVDEDATLAVAAPAGVLANDSDNASPVSALLVDGPRHGTLTLNADGSFVYTPGPDFNGTDAFTYRASDGMLVSEPATVTIAVRPVNDAPVAADDRAAVRKNKTLTLPASDLLANDTDPDGDALRVVSVASTADTHGRVTLANGTITYRPDRAYTGPATFTYTISDGAGGTATATVRVAVLRAQEGAPGRAAGRATLDAGRKVFSFAVTASRDADGLAIRGSLLYTDRLRRIVLRTTDFDLFDLSRDGRAATIAGTATVNGRDGYRFELQVEDRGGSTSDDRFRIRVTGPAGFSYDSGLTRGGRIDHGGNCIVGRSG
jgi:T5SS/PEP-CTERM-associated repeat protein/VCBS repeat-containing protein